MCDDICLKCYEPLRRDFFFGPDMNFRRFQKWHALLTDGTIARQDYLNFQTAGFLATLGEKRFRAMTRITDRGCNSSHCRGYYLSIAYGRGPGVGRGLAVGWDLGVGVGRGVADGVAVAVGLGVGVPPTAAKISTRPQP